MVKKIIILQNFQEIDAQFKRINEILFNKQTINVTELYTAIKRIAELYAHLNIMIQKISKLFFLCYLIIGIKN